MKDVSDQIISALMKYSDEVEATVQNEIKKTVKEGVSRLKETSPKRTGKYARGWRSNKRKDTYIINNRDKPGLTHLLENGHVGRDGKRVKPVKHIEPVYGYVEEIIGRIKEELL